MNPPNFVNLSFAFHTHNGKYLLVLQMKLKLGRLLLRHDGKLITKVHQCNIPKFNTDSAPVHQVQSENPKVNVENHATLPATALPGWSSHLAHIRPCLGKSLLSKYLAVLGPFVCYQADHDQCDHKDPSKDAESNG